MKSKLLLLVGVFASALIFTSCNGNSAKETEFIGVWGFMTQKGQYAELWVTNESLLIIKNPEARPYVFDYLRNGDTIKFYGQGMAEEGRTPMDKFYIVSREGDKLTKTQDGITTVLTLADQAKPEFDETEEFETKVTDDFGKRAAQK